MTEGIETTDERDFLVTHKVDLLQGYYFSPPRAEPDYVVSDAIFQ